VGSLAAHTGSDCHTVLVAGDSVAQGAGDQLASLLRGSGRCVDVVNVAVPATSLGDWGPDGPWSLAIYLDRYHPDVVLLHFVGNEGLSGLGPLWSDPDYSATAAHDAAALQGIADAHGVATYWADPAVSAWNCDFGQLSAQRFAEWAQWIEANGPTMSGHELSPWRHVFGEPDYSSTFSFPGVGAEIVRTPDCVHMTTYGDEVAATQWSITIGDLWSPTPPSSAPTVPTTSTPTSPTTSVPTTGSTTTTSSPGP
jgi:hypothetical protein